jgi:TonB family protein
LVMIGVIGSIAFHTLALSIVSQIEKPLVQEDSNPIELIVVQEPEPESPKIKPEKIIPKPQPQAQLKEIEPPKQKPTETIKTNPLKPQVKEVVKTNSFQPQPTNTVQSIPVPEEIIQPTKTPNPIATESNVIQPKFNTPNSTAKLENIAPLRPQQEVLTNNTLARNNIPRVIKPIDNNDENNNSWSNSFNSSPRAVNNSNTETSVSRVSDDVAVSSGRISRSSTRVQGAVTGSNSEGGNIDELRNSLNRSNGSVANKERGVSSISSNIAATSQSIPQRPKPKPSPSPESIKCISNCDPIYPSELQGAEGKATVKVNLDGSGNVLGVSVINPHSNPELNRQALLAARQMRFSSPSINNTSVPVSINFTVAGSEFDRLARQKKEEQQRLASLTQEKERLARQQQLEKERLQRQQQLEKERKEREAKAQLEREKQEQQLNENPPSITPSTNINKNENQPSLELQEKLETNFEGEN